MKRIKGISLLEIHLKRVKKSKRITNFIVATTDRDCDLPIIEVARKAGFAFSRGSELDVLDRFYQAVKKDKPDYIVRVTSDCPLIDAELIDKIIAFCVSNELDYASNSMDPIFPDGQDVEVFKFFALEQAWKNATANSEREHVTPYIWKNSTFYGKDLFKSDNFSEADINFGHLRMTVDDQADFELVKQLIEKIGMDKTWYEYALLMESDVALRSINSTTRRNEGYIKSLSQDN